MKIKRAFFILKGLCCRALIKKSLLKNRYSALAFNSVSKARPLLRKSNKLEIIQGGSGRSSAGGLAANNDNNSSVAIAVVQNGFSPKSAEGGGPLADLCSAVIAPALRQQPADEADSGEQAVVVVEKVVGDRRGLGRVEHDRRDQFSAQEKADRGSRLFTFKPKRQRTFSFRSLQFKTNLIPRPFPVIFLAYFNVQKLTLMSS